MAIYFPKSDYERKKAQKRFDHFMEKRLPFKMEGVATRTIPQNAKFHAMIGQIALEMGAPMDYVKLNIVKMKWCRSIFYIEDVVKSTGEVIKYVRSSKALSKEEMSNTIEIIIEKASLELKIVFPDDNSETSQEDWLRMQQEVEKNEKYL